MSSSKEQILEVLEKYGELNISKLARITGLHYRVLIKRLKELVEEGLVEERRFGRLRLFRIRK
ncbi:MAG: winged helix-turn-helix transcriptional regulator [Staphylothermus sp.]|nr:winged helix-turn-helix transcriptional regulator [Staphylothermus sp.]